jgi:hypothetical protein
MAAISPLLAESVRRSDRMGDWIARRAGLPLIIAAKVDKADRT